MGHIFNFVQTSGKVASGKVDKGTQSINKTNFGWNSWTTGFLLDQVLFEILRH